MLGIATGLAAAACCSSSSTWGATSRLESHLHGDLMEECEAGSRRSAGPAHAPFRYCLLHYIAQTLVNDSIVLSKHYLEAQHNYDYKFV
jgi:hypothetical protein